MVDLSGKENRLLDLSKVRDNRYKGAGIRVNESNWARCSALFSEWIVSANSAHGGTSPFPYGLYFLEGKVEDIADFPAELRDTPFLEAIPCDRPDRRAAKLTWNESGTEAEFSFVQVAALLGIDPPKGTTLWIDTVPLKDAKGKPVAGLPLGDHIQRQAVQDVAAAKANDAPK
ncbi:MAG TPA: hypothetical protein VGK74_11775 [Symbiobacteriaceae bacterium]|jgi:hypothetical protein